LDSDSALPGGGDLQSAFFDWWTVRAIRTVP
jgi:hypothetical protein